MCLIREVGGKQKGERSGRRGRSKYGGREENWRVRGRSDRNESQNKGERGKVPDRREGELEDYD